MISLRFLFVIMSRIQILKLDLRFQVKVAFAQTVFLQISYLMVHNHTTISKLAFFICYRI